MQSEESISGEEELTNVRASVLDRNFITLNAVAKAADRYDISDIATGAICTAVLEDIGLVTEHDKRLIVDRNKVRRARDATRKNQIEAQSFSNIKAIFFDGRKDDTSFFENNRIKMRKEEHISLVEEPGSFYIGHYPVSLGNSDDIVNKLCEHLRGK